MITGLLALYFRLVRDADKTSPGMEGVEDLQGDGHRVALSHGRLDIVKTLLHVLGLDHLACLTVFYGFHGRILGDVLWIIREQMLQTHTVLHQRLDDIIEGTDSIDTG